MQGFDGELKELRWLSFEFTMEARMKEFLKLAYDNLMNRNPSFLLEMRDGVKTVTFIPSLINAKTSVYNITHCGHKIS